MNRARFLFLFAIPALLPGPWALGQSSSLFKRSEQPETPISMVNGRRKTLTSSVAATSLMAVTLPPPRKFAVHDLVTIIVRESTSADSKSTLDTKKDLRVDGEITEWPNLQITDLLNMKLRPSKLRNGPIGLGVDYKNEFDGEGNRMRRDQFETRVTSRITDIKPNGTMVLEARKYIKTDKETVRLLVTGTCRPEDISVSNTVLSTSLYDLHVTNEHSGELYKASKKGLLTRFFELLFNF